MRDSVEYQREYARNIRNTLVQALGSKCVRCGFTDKRALQIDHVNGGGQRERRALKNSKIRESRIILESLSRGEEKYQLLCANCNWIKRFENGENNQYMLLLK